eukprot:tig00001206_g7507.t1
MAARDRTEHFLKRRQFYSTQRGDKGAKGSTTYQRLHDDEDGDGKRHEHRKLISGDASVPIWVNLAEEVSGMIPQIKAKMSELQKKYSKRLLPGFVDEDNKALEAEIELLTQEITKLLGDSEARVKQVSIMSDAANKRRTDSDKQGRIGATPKEAVRLNVQSSLAVQLSDLSLQFRKQQKHYMSRLQTESAGLVNLSQDQILNPDEIQTRDDVSDPGAAMSAEATIQKERSGEITKIAKSINELASIIKDLNGLVIDQGTLLDRIDYNMEQVSHNVEAANKELEKAEKHQKSGKFMAFVMCCGVIIIILFILLLIKHH